MEGMVSLSLSLASATNFQAGGDRKPQLRGDTVGYDSVILNNVRQRYFARILITSRREDFVSLLTFFMYMDMAAEMAGLQALTTVLGNVIAVTAKATSQGYLPRSTQGGYFLIRRVEWNFISDKLVYVLLHRIFYIKILILR
jgi:hypothetical protein